MRRLPLGLVFVAAVLTRRSEEEAAELFGAALADAPPEPLPAPPRRPRDPHTPRPSPAPGAPRGHRPRR